MTTSPALDRAAFLANARRDEVLMIICISDVLRLQHLHA
jgi:hypothetical protein